jgi:hypothetical protein
MQIRHRSGCPLGAQNQAARTIEAVDGEWPPFERLSAEQPSCLKSSDKWLSSRLAICY